MSAAARCSVCGRPAVACDSCGNARACDHCNRCDVCGYPHPRGVTGDDIEAHTRELVDAAVYEGRIVAGEPEVRVRRRGVASPLLLRLDIERHSPTGHAWGYAGSGPAQLALDVLADHFGVAVTPRFPKDASAADRAKARRALAIYQRVKGVFACIGLDHAWRLTAGDVRAIVAAVEAGHPLGAQSFAAAAEHAADQHAAEIERLAAEAAADDAAAQARFEVAAPPSVHWSIGGGSPAEIMAARARAGICGACIAQQTATRAMQQSPPGFEAFAFVYTLGVAEAMAQAESGLTVPLCTVHEREAIAARDAELRAAHDLGVLQEYARTGRKPEGGK